MTDPRTPSVAGPGIAVQVIRAFPERVDVLDLQLPADATVADALAAARAAGWQLAPDVSGQLAVYGKMVAPGATLRDGDRLEVLRPLLVDPMAGRRARARAAR